jgi:hypothetical protein
MHKKEKTSVGFAFAFGIVALLFLGGCDGAEAAGVAFKISVSSQSRIRQVQYQGASPPLDKGLTEAFVRKKCDALADAGGLPKHLQDIKLNYPGMDLTFAEFLCGAFAAGMPLRFEAGPEDPGVVRVQVKTVNIDFVQGRILADGKTFVGASSPIAGGTPALGFSKVTNTETGEVSTADAFLIALYQGWTPLMEAYLQQQEH